MHTHTHTHTHMHKYTHICTNIHTHMHKYTHIYTYTDIHTHRYAHAHTYTHTHMHTHTCISYYIEKNASSDGQIESEKVGVLVQIRSNSQANRRAHKLFGSDKIIFSQYLIWIIGFQN